MSHLPAEVLGVLGTAEGWVIREDLTAWEQVQDQGHPHARMALMWRLHGFREALWTTVNPKTVTLPCKVGAQCPSVPAPGSWDTTQGRIAPFCLLPALPHALAPGAAAVWVRLTATEGTSTEESAGSTRASTAGRSSSGKGRTEEGTGAGQRAGCKERQQPYDFMASEEKTLPRNPGETG